MAQVLTMPEVAAGGTAAILLEWGVAEGGHVTQGDTLVVIETDKATAEIPAETDGVLVRLLVEPNTEVAVGAPIAILGAPGENLDVDAFLASQGAGGTSAGAAPGSADAASPVGEAAGSTSGAVRRDFTGDRLFISPLARRLALEASLSPEDIPGSGPRGRITKRDVVAVVDNQGASRATAERVADPVSEAPDHEVIPHDRMRRAIATRLSASKQQAPHFYLKATCRVGALMTLRGSLNEVSPERISVNDIVVKAAGLALQRVPELNVTWHEDAVHRHRRSDVAIAVASPRGLVTPVLRHTETRGLAEIAHAAKDLRNRAEHGSLSQSDLDGGTLCVSNLGMYGVEEFTAIINPPQAAILAVGAVRDEVVAADGVPTVASVMTIVLSVDHRPVDGVVAGRWMRELVRLIEDPAQMLL